MFRHHSDRRAVIEAAEPAVITACYTGRGIAAAARCEPVVFDDQVDDLVGGVGAQVVRLIKNLLAYLFGGGSAGSTAVVLVTAARAGAADPDLSEP